MPVDEIMKNSDLFEKPGKNQHAFCTDIDKLGDVRVLCNVKPNSYWMGTLLHEFGHSTYDRYKDFNLPFILETDASQIKIAAVFLQQKELQRVQISCSSRLLSPAERN